MRCQNQRSDHNVAHRWGDDKDKDKDKSMLTAETGGLHERLDTVVTYF